MPAGVLDQIARFRIFVSVKPRFLGGVMAQRKASRSSKPNRYETVLDVPKESANLAFGIILGGEGHLWLERYRY